MDPSDKILESIRLYRDALQDTADLYRDAATAAQQDAAWMASVPGMAIDGVVQHAAAEDIRGLADQMADLQHGLVMKVYADAVPNDLGTSMSHRQLGRVLLEHLWKESVMGSRLNKAVQWIVEQADSFRWYDLVQPFIQLPMLRSHWGQLRTQITRMATLVADVDGSTDQGDHRRIALIETRLSDLMPIADETTPDRRAIPSRSPSTNDAASG
ncbi:MAG: hypothetical protein AAFP69_20570 [Planctomycetota bacterium]